MEIEYLSPAMMRDFRPSIDSWARDAAAYRAAMGARAELDVPYGGAPRQRLDLFQAAGGAGGPVALYIHGGYWQTMDKSFSSHVARGANERGVTVAIAGYTLCPETTISGIIEELRAAVAFVSSRFGKPVTVYGHSAGGHLSACMLAMDTVSAALPISGIFDLEPLVSTSLNKALGLDIAEARRLSPLFWDLPADKPVVAYVGGDESSEFLRQTRSLCARFCAFNARGVEVAGAGHFSVIGPLADPESAITRDLVQLAER